MESISVVVCTYNRADLLRSCLGTLARQLEPPVPWDLIVVDNNSTDSTRETVQESARALSVPVTYLFEGRQGKSHALNTGVSAATGDIVAFTDDDVLVDGEWLCGFVRTFRRYQCDLVGGRIRADWRGDRPDWYSTEGDYPLMAAVVEYEHGSEPCPLSIHQPAFGANMALRRSLFDRFGGFREDLGPMGSRLMRGEDTELCRRMIRGGARLFYSPWAVVDHPVEPLRKTKGYMLTWYHDYGASKVVEHGIPASTVWWFGFPRYLLRALVESLVRWLTRIDPQARFYWQLDVWRTSGALRAARRLRRNDLNRNDGPIERG